LLRVSDATDDKDIMECDSGDDGDMEVEMIVESDVRFDTDRLWDMESVVDQLSECDNEVEPEADPVMESESVLDAELEDDKVVDDDAEPLPESDIDVVNEAEFDTLPCEIVRELVPCDDKVPDGLIDLESPSTATAVSSNTTSDTTTRWQPDVIMF
jgi:hypothetical protein